MWENSILGSDPESGKTVYLGEYKKDFDGIIRFGTLEYIQGQWQEVDTVLPPWNDYQRTYTGLFYVPAFHGLMGFINWDPPEWVYTNSQWHHAPIENTFPNCWAMGAFDPVRGVFVTFNFDDEEIWELVLYRHCRPTSHP